MMKRMALWFPLAVLFVAACHFPQNHLTPAATAQRVVESVWTNNTLLVETEYLMVYYPDFVDPAEARKHADALQKGYDAYRVIFAFDDQLPYGGQKTAIVFDPRALGGETGMHNIIIMGSTFIEDLQAGNVNPPNPVFFHEMEHIFAHAQINAGRYYVDSLIGSVAEGLAEYLICHPEIFPLWETGELSRKYCDALLYGVDAKGPEYTLEYFEAHHLNPYDLDWSAHPPGPGGEGLFEQMLGRVSDAAGWEVWQKFYSATKSSGGNPAAKEAYLFYYEKKGQTMSDPLIKRAFAEYVTSLSSASGKDILSLFRGWGFEV